MKVLFMGTPEFAVPALEALVESPHEVVAVVCQPDKPKGRRRKLAAPPVKEAAEKHGLPVLQPARIRNKKGDRQKAFAEELAAYGADVAVVVAYGKILPREAIELPRHGCLNIHASLLPKYRGAAPINWAIVNGEMETGVSIMKIDEGLDTGDVLAMEKTEILADDDAQSMSNMLSVMGARLIVETLDAIDAGEEIEFLQQSKMGEPSHAPMLSKEDGWIDWTRDTERIICRINGFTPWPGAFAKEADGTTMKIIKAEPWGGELPEEDPDAEPGQVVATVKGRGFLIKTASGWLLPTRVKPANKGEMDAWSACNGNYVTTKTQFVSPPKSEIDESESQDDDAPGDHSDDCTCSH